RQTHAVSRRPTRLVDTDLRKLGALCVAIEAAAEVCRAILTEADAEGIPMMRSRMPALTIIALLGFCIQGNAPGIDPAAQRGPRGPKPVDDRSRVGALLYVHSFVAGVGRSSAIRK